MFSLDLKGGVPLYEQLYSRISELIASGALEEDDKLPAVREVAKDLGINPNTVQKAYRNLEKDKLTYSVPARGSYVAKRAQTINLLRERALHEFNMAVLAAVERGLSKDELHAQINFCKEGM